MKPIGAALEAAPLAIVSSAVCGGGAQHDRGAGPLPPLRGGIARPPLARRRIPRCDDGAGRSLNPDLDLCGGCR